MFIMYIREYHFFPSFLMVWSCQSWSQGYYKCGFMHCTVALGSFWSSWWWGLLGKLAPLSGCYFHTFFQMMVHCWLALRIHPRQTLTAVAGKISVFRISFPEYYRKIDQCPNEVFAASTWVPCLVFETMLCLLAIYAGIKHSRGQSWWSMKANRPRLIGVLIQGNVIYFLRLVFSCHCCK